MPQRTDTKTAELNFMNRCFRTDNKEAAAKVLRLVSMIEHENSNLHYALLMKNWLEEDDITLSGYYQNSSVLNTQMKDLGKKLKETKSCREATEKLFFTHWSYVRNKSTHEKAEQLNQLLHSTSSEILQNLSQEECIDKDIKKAQSQLLETFKKIQERVNEVLVKDDRVKFVSTPNKDDQSLFSKIFSPDSKSGVRQTQISSFQNDAPKYASVNEFIKESFGCLFTDYGQMINLLDKIPSQKQQRDQAIERVKNWQRSTQISIGQFASDEATVSRLAGLFEISMISEIQKACTKPTSLCQTFETFIRAQYANIADGNWEDSEAIEKKHSPDECLKRETIGSFRKCILDYKESTKSLRGIFSKINRALMFIGLTTVLYFAIKGLMSFLPISVKASATYIKIAGLFSIPVSITIAVPLAFAVLVCMNLRYAKCLKSEFTNALNQFGKEAEKDNDQDCAQDTSYYSWLKSGVGCVFSYLNCFKKKECDEPKDETYKEDEDCEFVGGSQYSQKNNMYHGRYSGTFFEQETRYQRSDSRGSVETVDLDSDDENNKPESHFTR